MSAVLERFFRGKIFHGDDRGNVQGIVRVGGLFLHAEIAYKSRRIRVAVNDFGHPVSTQTPRQKDRQRETHTSTQTAFDRLYYKLSQLS